MVSEMRLYSFRMQRVAPYISSVYLSDLILFRLRVWDHIMNLLTELCRAVKPERNMRGTPFLLTL